ncbi:hypothetical protein RJ640_009502 [Escallonia rubra]|uniref:RNase H type-1 domain-containing protein n=1 Tax=Escallonia rubra TaxID=112253 RepID=A0AA88QXW2_9ASTE|nr:hypothetical protein RJ640_009502 [Escallonia rubra]
MVKMFQKVGLDCTSTHNPPPFETMMNEEQVDALLTGRTLKHSRRGLWYRDSKSFAKKTVNMTSYATECEDFSPAPLEYEEGGQATIDELREVNLGTKEDPRPTMASALMSEEEVQQYTNFLKEYRDVFAWSYTEMPGLDPKMKPPVLMAPVKGKPMILYTVAMDTSLGALLAQHNDQGKENALYYLSQTLARAKLRYTAMEKVCRALVFALQKLKHYLGEHEIHLISRADPLKYILSRSVLTGRLARWAVILHQFNIEYVPQKAVKGQALADFLAAHPVPDDSPLVVDLPDEEVMQTKIKKGWEMYFDGASRSPDGEKQNDPKNNQSAEYEAIIAGLELSLEVPIDDLTIYGDSELIVKQLRGEYQIRKPNLLPYYERANYLLSKFPKLHIRHVRRGVNGRVDALASLAASLGLYKNREMTITVGARRIPQPNEKVDVDVQTEEVLTMLERLEGQDNQLDWH